MATDRDAGALVRWILTEGRAQPSPTRLVGALCGRLVEAGVPLWRVTVYAATLHPQIRGYGWRWWRDRGVTEEVRIAQGTELSDEYLASPLRDTIERGSVTRHRLDGGPSAFPLLEEFRAEGCTEYLVAPLNRVAQRYPVVAWATDRAGGFDDGDAALLEEIRPALAAVVETIVTRRTARGLFAIYHGSHVGDRVFDGQILRGHYAPLRAVIMATDLRGFTGISDRLLGDEVIGALDDYFEHVAASVHAAGGHVLKFIGDGVLAIFSTDGDRDGAAASAGLAAARDIVMRLAAHNAAGGESGRVELRAGIGLHLGSVMYGNVGAPDRLDFTAIGPAVNLAFRLEGLTKVLHRPVLASRALAEAAASPLRSLGLHPIPGLDGLEEVFALPEHDPPP
ncbi:MAG TPA: adenylate/guanylate cyclase domain-containing protein [Stellaceae bacterium]|nr:adenylate/guanylate cyclase domain-containing protein [Stellaceae bacterium]